MTLFLTPDSPMAPYMAFPRFLMDSELNETAKILYTVLLDRARLSINRPGWTDQDGHVFIYFPIKKLAQTLHKSEMTIKNALAALEQENLILRVRQSMGQPNRIYVLCHRDKKLSTEQTENCPPDGKKTVPHTDRILSTSNNKIVKTRKQEHYNRSDALRTYECTEDECL
jgi:hypothetical protein